MCISSVKIKAGERRPIFTQLSYEAYIEGLEKLKFLTESGVEYWMARDLMSLLEYDQWRNFRLVLDRAMNSCESANMSPSHHFVETSKMVSIGSGAQRSMQDWFLTRYACYLIAMNADPTKTVVGYAQTYFAAQTRLQELSNRERRLKIRLRVIDANKNLNSTARRAGVERFPLFHDGGYRGLYGGRGLAEIRRYKGLGDREDLLDRAGATELAANEFRITQTDQKIIREQIKGEQELICTHRMVGQEVRSSIDRMGGAMPEDLAIEPSIKPLVDLHRRGIQATNNKIAS